MCVCVCVCVCVHTHSCMFLQVSPYVLSVIRNVFAIVTRDSCSSNLLAAAQTQAIISFKRSSLPGQLIDMTSSLVSDANINTTQLIYALQMCNAFSGSGSAACTILQNLLDLALHPDPQVRNVTFRSLARTVTSNQPVEKDASTRMTDSEQPGIYMMVVPGSSREALAVSPVLSVFRIPHFSPWASSPIFSNIDEYPFFFRAVPSDRHQVLAIADLIEDLGFTYLSLVAGDDDAYSGHGFNLLRAQAIERGTFCFASQERFSLDDPLSVVSAVERSTVDPRAKAIVLFATVQQGRAFLNVFDRLNINDRILIGSADWVNRIDFKMFPANSSVSSTPILGFMPDAGQIFPVLQGFAAMFTDNLRKPDLVYQASMSDIFMQLFIEREGNCSFNAASSCRKETSRAVRNCSTDVIKTVLESQPPLSILLPMIFLFQSYLSVVFESLILVPVCRNGTCSVLGPPIDPAPLREALRNHKLPCRSHNGTNRHCNTFTEDQFAYPGYQLRMLRPVNDIAGAQSGNRAEGVALWDGEEGSTFRSRLTWYSSACLNLGGPSCVNMTARHSSLSRAAVPRSSCSEDCEPGTRRLVNIMPFMSCCWICVRCPSGQVSETVNADVCIECKTGLVTNSARSRCIPPVIISPPWSPVWTLVVIVLSAILFISSLCTLTYFIYHRDQHIIRASNLPHMITIMITTSIGAVLAPGLTFTPHTTTLVCGIEYTLILCTLLLIELAIVMKTNRLRHLFKTLKLVKYEQLRHLLLLARYQVGLILFWTCVFGGIAVIVVVKVPIEPRLVFIDEQRAGFICDYRPVHYAYTISVILMLSLSTVLLVVRTRNLPDEFNDSRLIAISSLISFLVFISFTPAFFAASTTLQPLLFQLIMLAFHGSVLFSLCVPRVVRTHFELKRSSSTTQRSSSSHSIGKLHGGTSHAASRVESRRSCGCQCTCGRTTVQVIDRQSCATIGTTVRDAHDNAMPSCPTPDVFLQDDKATENGQY